LQCLPPLSSPSLKSATAQLRDRNADAADDLATLAEIFADTATDGAITGFVLAHLHGATAPVLWVQDRVSMREAGKPSLAGLPVPLRILHVSVSKPVDVLWTMEEGLRCTGLSAVVGEVWGDPPALDFTATKRLALRAEARALPAFLLRRAAQPNLSAARLRWRVASLPSAPDHDDMRAPGQPLWRADLFRARWRTPGQWVASHDDTGLHLAHAIHTDADTTAAQRA
jgi:protein ImuA